MVRIPNVTQIAAFPEPDHAPEIHAQHVYETLRDGDWAWAYEGVLDDWEWTYDGALEVTARASGTEEHTCAIPSHQRWAVERWGKPRDFDECGLTPPGETEGTE